MTKECELLENCPYFNIYSKQTKAKEAWVRLFCMDKNKSEKCERKKILDQTKEQLPINMSPIGEMLPVD